MVYRCLGMPAMLAALMFAQGCSRNEQAGAPDTTAPGPAPQTAPTPSDTAGATTAPGATADRTQAAAGAGAAPSNAGAQTYSIYCQSCHGPDGHGNGPAAAGLNPKPASFADNAFRLDANGNKQPGEVEDIVAIVRDGAAKYGGSPMMAPWPMLSPEQLQSVAQHVKTMGGGA